MEEVKAKLKFFNFPVAMIPELYYDRENALKQIFYYAIYQHKIKQDCSVIDALKYYGWNNPSESLIFDCENIGAHNCDYYQPPLTSINTTIFVDYLSDPNKSEKDVISLAAFLALRSIAGRRNYAVTNYNHLIARMSGESKWSVQLSDQLSGKVLYGEFTALPFLVLKKYIKRRRLEAIRQELIDRWNVTIYSTKGMRGFAFSIGMSLEDLIFEIESQRKNNKAINYRNKVETTKKKVLEKLYTE